MAEQRFTAPVLGNEGEQAVLDLVPFAGAWRQMANSNGDAEFVGQDLQLAFPQAYPCAVAAAAIGIDQQTSCGRITRAAEFIPPAADALDGEGRRVMIDAEIDPSYVRGDVVDAVRHGLTEFRDHEVMHTNRLRLPLWPQFAAAILEVADKLPSRPGELHPEPLTEPDVRLSPHTARATRRRLPPSADIARFLRFLVDLPTPPRVTRPLRSTPITGTSALLRSGPPQFPASVLSPRGVGRLCFSLVIRELVPAVPRKSLCPTHAPYTPVAVRPVIRLPADLSQEKKAPLVLTTLDTLTTRLRWVCLR